MPRSTSLALRFALPFGVRFTFGFAVLALASPGVAGAQPYFDAPWRAFQTARTAATGHFALGIEAADLNGDGRADAVLPQNVFAPGLRVMLNLGAAGGAPATLQEEGTLYPTPRGASDVVIADLDGDGDLDLAAPDSDVNNVGTNLVVLRNAGDGTFQPAQSYPAGGRPTHIDAADVDGDGDRDLVLVAYTSTPGGGTVVSVVRNAGDATFGPPATFALSAEGFTGAVAAGDLDGDGDADLAVAHFADRSRLVLFFNAGGGAFGAPVAFTPFEGHTAPSEVVLLDPDGDGDLDVLSPGFHEPMSSMSHLVLLRNGGAGAFAAQTFAYGLFGQDLAHELTAVDLDGDGRDDAVGAQPFEAGYVVFRDDEAGGFRAGEMYAAVTRGGDISGTIATAAGDLDGDGDPDVLTTSRVRRLVSVHENRGGGAFPERPVHGHATSHQVIDLGDVDGDGDLDAATSHGGVASANVLVFASDGAGAFAQTHLAPGGGAFAKLRDLDGDGRLDLLWVSAPTAPPYDFFTARGNGDGTFQPAVRHPLNTCGSAHPNAVDLDADGDLDVVNTEDRACLNLPESGKRLFISLNNGNGTFQPAIVVQAGGGPYNTVAGDFDEDGHVDLATSSTGISAIVFGNGDGTFRQPATTIPIGRAGQNVLALDLNADGHLDLASLDDYSPVSQGDESMLAVLLGTGAGTFTETEFPEHRTQDFRDWVAAGDVDADGDPDLLAGGVQDALVFRNDGAGAFAYAGRYGVGAEAHALHYADADGDGRGDLVALVAHEDPPAGLDNGLVVVPGLTGAVTAVAPGASGGEAGVALAVAPNPVRDRASVTLTLDRAQAVAVAVYDALGRRVATLHDGVAGAGALPLALDAGGLPPGVYAVRAVGEGTAASTRLVVGR